MGDCDMVGDGCATTSAALETKLAQGRIGSPMYRGPPARGMRRAWTRRTEDGGRTDAAAGSTSERRLAGCEDKRSPAMRPGLVALFNVNVRWGGGTSEARAGRREMFWGLRRRGRRSEHCRCRSRGADEQLSS